MWEMYLLGCEMAFKHQYLSVMQMQITREINTLPITRDYMMQTEKALALSDHQPSARKKRAKKRLLESA